MPAVVILAGSGPTDRNGNSPAIQGEVGTLSNFAAALADRGVASLRYDKVGSGATGLASFAGHAADIGLETYVQEALDALTTLRARPEVDPLRVAILGHSEGGLIALIAAGRLVASQGVQALILASPVATNDVDLAARQLRQQYSDALKSGVVTQATVDSAMSHLDAIVASLTAENSYPVDMANYEPALRQVFNPSAEHFLADMSHVNGLSVARSLPGSLPVLVMHGSKDQQVPGADVRSLVTALRSSANTHVEVDELADVDHVYKVVAGTPSPGRDYGNPSLPFSLEAGNDLGAFAENALR